MPDAGLTTKAKRAEYGSRIERLDRRREVWGLRAKGLSIRAIAEEMGIPRTTAWADLQRAEAEWGEIATDPAVLREGLLQLHTQINGLLFQQMQQQAEHGQVTVEVDGQGRRTTTTRQWINPQIAAEASRNLVRLAGLMGLSEQNADGGGGGQNTTVVMVSPPADGASFEARYSQAPAIDVSTAQEPQEGPSAAP